MRIDTVVGSQAWLHREIESRHEQLCKVRDDNGAVAIDITGERRETTQRECQVCSLQTEILLFFSTRARARQQKTGAPQNVSLKLCECAFLQTHAHTHNSCFQTNLLCSGARSLREEEGGEKQRAGKGEIR